MKGRRSRWLIGAAAVWLAAPVPVEAETAAPQLPDAGPEFAAFHALPPGERYRQYLFVLQVTDGFSAELLAELAQLDSVQSASAVLAQLTPDGTGKWSEGVPNAGLRVAAPALLVASTAALARFRLQAEPQIRAELASIAAAYPVLVAMIDEVVLAEEALIYRQVFSESAEAVLPGNEGGGQGSGPGSGGQAGEQKSVLDDYLLSTQRIRNDTEFLVYERQVDGVVDRVAEDSAAQMDAWHRMSDEGTDSEFIRERGQAADDMNETAEDESRRMAAERALRMLWLLGPMLNRYYISN